MMMNVSNKNEGGGQGRREGKGDPGRLMETGRFTFCTQKLHSAAGVAVRPRKWPSGDNHKKKQRRAH